MVEGGDAVGRDHEQVVANRVQVANFATSHEVEAGQIRFKENGQACGAFLLLRRSVREIEDGD